MSLPDLGQGFDGWQVLDPTPQEKSGGIFCCSRCSVKGLRKRRNDALYDAPFIYASVNADVVTVIVRDGVGDECVHTEGRISLRTWAQRDLRASVLTTTVQSLEVSLKIEKEPRLGENIYLCVTVTNRANVPKVLKEHLNAQTKEDNGSPRNSFWEAHKQFHMAHVQFITRFHTLEYENMLVGEGLLNLAVVIKDERTKEWVLASEELNIITQQISIEVIGGDNIQLEKVHSALVSFIDGFTIPLSGAVLTVEGSGLMEGKDQTNIRVYLVQPGQTMEKNDHFTPTTTATKLLQASLVFNNSLTAIRNVHKVSVSA
ncbi:unnamed protein product [Coregonus sp. 'balchen']|nr:unnamed protein product [Coregonus sp. 'balchen']